MTHQVRPISSLAGLVRTSRERSQRKPRGFDGAQRKDDGAARADRQPAAGAVHENIDGVDNTGGGVQPRRVSVWYGEQAPLGIW